MNMQPIYVDVWAQFEPVEGNRWKLRAWAEPPGWLPNAKFYLVKIPVPAELYSDEPVVAEVNPEDGNKAHAVKNR